MVTGLIYRGSKQLHAIRIWLIFVCVEELLEWMMKFLKISDYHSYRAIDTNLFNLFAVSLLYIFFRSVITRRSFQITMLVLYVSYLVADMIVWLPMHRFQMFTGPLVGFSYFCIAIPCVFYFYDLLRSELETDLKNDPVFYVVCGIFCYYAVAVPFSITYNILYDATPVVLVFLYLTSSIFDLVMKVFLIKAFLCTAQRQKYSLY